jgi:hypothetical protein
MKEGYIPCMEEDIYSKVHDTDTFLRYFLMSSSSFVSYSPSLSYTLHPAQDSHLDLDDARFPKAQLLMDMDLFFGRKNREPREYTNTNILSSFFQDCFESPSRSKAKFCVWSED